MHAPAIAIAARPSGGLTTDLMLRLEAASRVLMSPLAADDLNAWRQQTMQAVCGVFGADQASFSIPHEEDFIGLWGLDDSLKQVGTDFLRDAMEGGTISREPLLVTFMHRAIRNDLRVWDMHVADHTLGGVGMAWDNLWHNEVLAPNHMTDTNSLFVPMRGGAAHLAIHRFLRPHEPGEHLPLLRVLLPAFEAGLAALDRLSAHRAALDAVEEPLAVFDADGHEVHRNTALVRQLAGDPEAVLVERALARLSLQMRPFAFPLRMERPGLPIPERTVATTAARYTLRATLLPQGMYGTHGSLLIAVTKQQAAPLLPTSEAVRARFGLTRREAETAVLVAEGLSNDDIAERLFVSRHTVRHHLESIMAKLDLTGKGRGAIALRLLQA